MSSSAGTPADDPARDPAAQALAMASVLGETLTEIARRLEQYSAFGRRSRKIIIGLVVSFTLDIILTVVLGLTAVQAHGAASANALLVQELHTQEMVLHAAQLQACANGNVFRVDQTTIWRDFIRILTTPAPNPADMKLAARFLAYVATVNHPVNCIALYGK